MVATDRMGGNANYVPEEIDPRRQAIEQMQEIAAQIVTKPKPKPAPKPVPKPSVVSKSSSSSGSAGQSLMGYTGPSASQMAAAEYAPQFKMLQNLLGQAQTGYNTGNAALGNMYGALSKSISGEIPGVQQQYKRTGSDIGAAFNNALSSINQASAATKSSTAEMLKRLGIQQAAPSLYADQDLQTQLYASLLAANRQNFQNTNTALGQSTVDYTRDTANNAGLAGKNAQADLLTQLTARQNELGNKRLDLTGQQKATENKYGLSISQMQQAAQAAQQEALQASQANAYKELQLQLDAQRNATTSERDRASAMLGASRFGLDQQQFNAAQEKASRLSQDPFEKLATTARSIYGTDESARNAAKAITDTYSRGFEGKTNWANLSEFMQAVGSRNPRAADATRLQQLASVFYPLVSK